MSASEKKTWLVCYDICEPRRLGRVHRRLRKEGATVQYSAFSVRAGDAALQRLLADLALLIDKKEDDLRAYHLPDRCPVWTLGVQQLPDGIHVDAATASHMLLGDEHEMRGLDDGKALPEDLSFL